MVYQQANKSKTLTFRRTNYGVVMGVLGVLVATMVLCFYVAFFDRFDDTNTEEQVEVGARPTEQSAYESPDDTEVILERIDFQPVVDEWTAQTSGDKGVAIYDLDLGEMVGEYNADKQYGTASLYKLFVVYEGYRRIESGEWLAEDNAGTTGYTIAECLDLAIRESHSPCAETLWSEIGRDALDMIVEQEFGIEDSVVSGLVATPSDIAKMMKIFYEHGDISDETLLAQMRDSFLNQPETEYDWRQGLPSGFSDDVEVYNKVGWAYDAGNNRWTIYDDAAIVDFSDQGRHFVVVVMTSGVPYQRIRDFGTMVEEYFNKNI